MNLIGGTEFFRYFKIISVNNKKVKDEGRYKTKASPGHAAKKAFTQLSKKYKKNKLTFSIKETTQGSEKKNHGPYLGEKIKLKKPLEVKYKGKNEPVMIKYETKIHLVKDHKQKGGRVTLKELSDFNKELESIHSQIKDKPGFKLRKERNGYLGNDHILGHHKFISDKFQKMERDDTRRKIVAKEVSSTELQNILKAERDKADKILNKYYKKQFNKIYALLLSESRNTNYNEKLTEDAKLINNQLKRASYGVTKNNLNLNKRNRLSIVRYKKLIKNMERIVKRLSEIKQNELLEKIQGITGTQ